MLDVEKNECDDKNVDWNKISQIQILSEDFIEKHKDLVNWDNISKYQCLSEKFIEKHKNKVNWKYISSNQKLSEEFIERFKDNLDIDLVNANWLNKPEGFKKILVMKTGLYECYSDYFIAYTTFFEEVYLGMILERFADGSNDEYGFGLSVMSKEDVVYLTNKEIIKCKVYYKDVARILYDFVNGEIRCSKYEVVEIINKKNI